MEKGILTKELECLLAKQLDALVVLKNGILEALDGTAFKIALSTIDDNVADKIPEPWKTNLRAMLTDILEEKDYQEACTKAALLIDELIDIPGLDDDTEHMIFTGIFTVVAGLLAKIGTDAAL